jgi:hypothetical protein
MLIVLGVYINSIDNDRQRVPVGYAGLREDRPWQQDPCTPIWP